MADNALANVNQAGTKIFELINETFIIIYPTLVPLVLEIS